MGADKGVWHVDAKEVQWLGYAGDAPRAGLTVGSFVPQGLDRYLLIAHPAQLEADDGSVVDVSWHEVAQRNNKLIRPPFFRFDDIVGSDAAPGVEFAKPLEGDLSDDLCCRLVSILGEYSGAHCRCVFAFFDAWASMVPVFEEFTTAWIQDGRYLIAGGDLAEVCTSSVSPTMWWPENRTWIMVSPIDLEFSLIGCDQFLASSLLSENGIEAWQVALDDPVYL